jgi:hypothetical protein
MTKFESHRFSSKANTKKYEDNYDRIFKKDKKKVEKDAKKSNTPRTL